MEVRTRASGSVECATATESELVLPLEWHHIPEEGMEGDLQYPLSSLELRRHLRLWLTGQQKEIQQRYEGASC